MPKGQHVHGWAGRAIGLDLHRDFCEIAICEEGQTCGAGRVATTPEGIEALAESLLPTDRVVMEVSSGAWEVARRLEGRCPGRYAPSMSASWAAAGTARRSSPPPASSLSCSGACSTAARTTPTSSRR